MRYRCEILNHGIHGYEVWLHGRNQGRSGVKKHDVSIPYINKGDTFISKVSFKKLVLYNGHINISLTLYPYYCTMYIIVDNCLVQLRSVHLMLL